MSGKGMAGLRLLIIATVWVALVGATNSQGGCELPVVYSVASGFGGVLDPESPPPGANRWTCKPSSDHPNPVILVHGTMANQHNNWNALSPLLYNNGYCVFTLNYGGPPLLGTVYGLGPIAESAQELAAFVDKVLQSTGAKKVDLVGHSQGGMMPHYYIKNLGGAAKVNHLVALAPSNGGTTLAGLTEIQGFIPGVSSLVHEGLANVCPACLDQEQGSAFLRDLHAGGLTARGVKYTVISSIYDQIVTPWQSQQLSGKNVTNIVLQNLCPIDFDGHAGVAYDHIALQQVLNALDPAHATQALCTAIAFDVGG